MHEPYYFRGKAKHQLEDFRGAILDFNKAIEIKPFYPEAYMHRALAYLQLNENQKAMADYDKAIALDPNNDGIYNNRGIAKKSMKDYDGAMADFNKALKINPKSVNSLINRSLIKQIKDDKAGAVKDLNQVILIRPHYEQAYFLRGNARLDLKDYASAIKDFDVCLKLDPKYALAYTNRGVAKQRLGDSKGAIMDYNTALEIDPTIALAYKNRGLAKGQLNRSGAEDDLATAVKLDPMLAYDEIEVDSEEYDQAKKDISKLQQPPHQGTPSSDNSDPLASITDNILDKETKKEETKEEKERRRYRIGLADSKNTIDPEDKVIDNGLIQNKNIIIDLQPIFILSSYDKYSNDFERTQYYNLELEEINNFNNYNPVITISNKPEDHLKEVFENNILYFNEKIKTNSRESMHYLSRGIFYSLIEDYNSSVGDLQRAIELNNQNALAYFSRANSRLKIADLVQQLKPTSASITVPLNGNQKPKETDVVETITDYHDVLNDYSKCLALNPNFAFAYFNQAYVKCKMRDYESALADLNKALDIEKDFAEAYYNRGLTKIYLDDVEGGAIDLSKAGELGIQDAYNVIKRYCN